MKLIGLLLLVIACGSSSDPAPKQEKSEKQEKQEKQDKPKAARTTTLGEPVRLDGKGKIRALVFGDGALLSAGSEGGETRARRWDVAKRTSETVASGGAHVQAFSPDGRRLVVIDASNDLPRIGEPGAPPLKLVLDGNNTIDTDHIVFSADGRWVATAGLGMAGLVDTTSGKVTSWPVEAQAVGISDDGTSVALASDDVRIWSPPRRDAAPALVLPGRVLNTSYLGFAGDRLIVADEKNGVVVWERERKLRTLHPADDPAYAGALSRDHRLLATGHGDGAVRVWDLEALELVASKKSHDALVTALAFSADGRSLATGDRDGRILVWPLR